MSLMLFDKIIDRTCTHSAKWDTRHRYDQADIIPLSVADMDLASPPEVIEHLAAQNTKGIYGYSILPDDYYQNVQNYFFRHYRYRTEEEEIVFCPRIIQAISIYIQFFTKEQDGICILTPSYSPIFNSIILNHRQAEKCELIYQNGQYHIDFIRLEQCFQKCKAFILISPHNPTGTVWSRADLQQIARLAQKYRIFILSDDVHADFDFSGHPHRIISAENDYVKQHSIICTSPAKTFNIAGLEIANLIIHNAEIRRKFKRIMLQLGMHNPNFFAVSAIQIAYRDCDYWLERLRTYILENKKLVQRFFAVDIPELEITRSEGTYLLWVNYEKLHIDEQQLKHRLIHHAKVEMSWGSDFGEEVRSFFRMNIALPRAVLQDCLYRIKESLILYQQEG